jgi:hypothetical protein
VGFVSCPHEIVATALAISTSRRVMFHYTSSKSHGGVFFLRFEEFFVEQEEQSARG